MNLIIRLGVGISFDLAFTELAGLFNVEPLGYLAPPITVICVSDALCIIKACFSDAGVNIGLFIYCPFIKVGLPRTLSR